MSATIYYKVLTEDRSASHWFARATEASEIWQSLADALDDLGQAGWELVHVRENGSNSRFGGQIILASRDPDTPMLDLQRELAGVVQCLADLQIQDPEDKSGSLSAPFRSIQVRELEARAEAIRTRMNQPAADRATNRPAD